MKQRISVRVRVISGNRVLVLRRADGRPSILGKYELPGGRLADGEQPDDAAHRFLKEDVGVKGVTNLQLEDAMTYVDTEDREIQYAVIVYRAIIGNNTRAIKLSDHYDKYVWYTPGKVKSSAITDVSKLVLGTMPLPMDTELPAETRKIHPHVVAYTDGGSRGNPGPSAAGYVVIEGGEIVDQGGEYIGITTNNQAEYHGVRLGLEAAIRLGVEELEVRIDSMLVVNQLNGIYKIKNRELWPVNERVKDLMGEFKRIKFVHVPREMNQLADGMVNRTLDKHKSRS